MGQVKQYYYSCRSCGDCIDPERYALGYRVCLPCGEQAARVERTSWCVVQPFNLLE